MALIDHIDGEARLIYLNDSTVDTELSILDLYKELNSLRASNDELKKYTNFMDGSGHKYKGKNAKGEERYTQRLFTMIKNAKIVPYNTSHILTITDTIITDDGQEGVYCFNRSVLDAGVSVDISYQPLQVEVITITTGGDGLDEKALHTALDNYANKDAYKANKDDIATAVWSYTI